MGLVFFGVGCRTLGQEMEKNIGKLTTSGSNSSKTLEDEISFLAWPNFRGRTVGFREGISHPHYLWWFHFFKPLPGK